MALTPEELAELEILNAELGDEESISEDEQLELEMLNMELAPKKITSTKEDLERFTIEGEPEAGAMEAAGAAAMGVIRGASLEFVDEAIAGTSAIIDTINDPDKTWSEIGATYDQAKADTKAAMGLMVEENPVSSALGEMVGTVAIPLAPGVGAKLAGATLKSAAAVGTLRGIGKAENLQIDGETAKSLATEVGMETLGFGAGKALGFGIKQGRKIAAKASSTMDPIVFARKQANALVDALGVRGTANMQKFLDKAVDRRGLTTEQVASELIEDLEIMPGMDPTDIYSNMKAKMHELWTGRVQPLLDEIDNVNSVVGQGVLDLDTVKKTVLMDLSEADNFIGMESEQIEKIVTKLAPFLSASEDGARITLNGAQELVNQLGRRTNNVQAKNIIQKSIREQIADTVERYSRITPGIGPEDFKDLKRRYGNIAEMQNFVLRERAAYLDAVREYDVSTVGFWAKVKGVLTAVSPVGNDASVGKRISRLANIFKLKSPEEYAPSTTLFSIQAMGQKLLDDPEKYSDLAHKVMVGATRGARQFVDALGAMEAHMTLEEVPMEKSMGHMMEYKSQIYKVLKEDNEALANQFLKAVNDGDDHTVAKLMSSLEAFPKFKKFMNDPLPGFVDANGERILVDEIQQAKARDMVKHSGISQLQRTQAERVIKAGKLPMLPDPAVPFEQRFKLKTRDEDGRKVKDM